MEPRDISGFINKAHILSFPYKIFVKEQEPENAESNLSKPVASSVFEPKNLNGEDTKHFYESVIQENFSEKSEFNSIRCEYPTHNTPINDSIKRLPRQTNSSLNESLKNKQSKASSFSKNQIMLAIQKDDINTLNIAFEQGWEKEIMFGKDCYGWNSVMVAACAGSLKTIKILLERGASVHEKDKAGNTCLSLAKKNRHYNVVNYINLHTDGKTKKTLKPNKTNESKDNEPFDEKYCELCDVTFHSYRIFKQHASSTVHLLNFERKELQNSGGHPKVHYSISQANRGFQMMLSKGWDSNVGLGPSGKGKLYPVKTVLKRDRQGLGSDILASNGEGVNLKKAKVTHFGAYDSTSVKREKDNFRKESFSTLNKKKRIAKELKSTKKEIDYRREFMTL